MFIVWTNPLPLHAQQLLYDWAVRCNSCVCTFFFFSGKQQCFPSQHQPSFVLLICLQGLKEFGFKGGCTANHWRPKPSLWHQHDTSSIWRVEELALLSCATRLGGVVLFPQCINLCNPDCNQVCSCSHVMIMTLWEHMHSGFKVCNSPSVN